MKRFFPVLLISLFSLVACQREVDDLFSETESATASGSFTAKIDGVPWTADRVAYAHFSDAANGAPALFSIFGLSIDKKIVGFVTADSGVHVYTLTDNSLSSGVFQDSSLPDVNSFASLGAPVQPSGVFNLRTIDTTKKTVSGTFSFIAYRDLDNQQRTITDGVFTDIPYTKDADLPAAAANDTFAVKIDGTAFAPYGINATNMTVTNSIMVQGRSQTGGKTVGLSFPNDIVPGTYTLDLFGGTHIGVYLDGTTSLSSTSGSLKILEHNKNSKRVRGQFSFKAEALGTPATAVQLTDGYFSVTYP